MITEILSTIEDDDQRNELNEIYLHNEKKFLDIAYSKLNDKIDAQDAVQEAFLRIADEPDKLFNVPAEKRISFINVVIRNVSFEMLRKRNKIQKNETELSDETEVSEPMLDDLIISRLSVDTILGYISSLSEKLKEALYYKVQFDMSYSLIARELGISENAVKKRISRAAQLIKQFLEDNNDE